MNPAAVEVRDLEFRYPDGRTALRGVNLRVEAGVKTALLGPNGAGKTTAVEVMEGFRQADEGQVEVLGHDPGAASREFRDRIGIVLQETGIEQNIRVREALDFYGASFSRRLPTADLIEKVGLGEKADAKIKTLSGGQKRRLDLALGLVGDPDLVFLDEPTTGFDPAARRKSWELVEGLTSLGKTILLTTHYLDEAQHLADRVIVLSQGLIVAEGAPDEIGAEGRLTAVSFRIDDPSLLPRVDEEPTFEEGTATYQTGQPTALLYQLTRWATERGGELEGLTVALPSLEEVYLDIVGETETEGSE